MHYAMHAASNSQPMASTLAALSHYLGHRSLQSTERYTAQSAARFKDFFRD
jgi:hypothetical protein